MERIITLIGAIIVKVSIAIARVVDDVLEMIRHDIVNIWSGIGYRDYFGDTVVPTDMMVFNKHMYIHEKHSAFREWLLKQEMMLSVIVEAV